MKLLFLIGSGAVGKMTVGQELSKITDLKLFHNHMSIEPIIEIFGSYNTDVIKKFRNLVFEEFAKSDNYGLIFTYIWAFDLESDWKYIEHVKDIFKVYNSDFYYVELIAPQEIRLARNKTPNRIANKNSKKDLVLSENRMLKEDATYRLVSNPQEIPFKNYMRIENSNLSAEEVANLIKVQFDFK